MIEAGAIVFPRDGRGQFHQLRVGEAFAKLGEERIRHFDRSLGDCVGIFKNEPFQIRKI